MTNETRIDIPISKTDEDARMVFGWANVPRPKTTEEISKAYAGSVEEALQKVSEAYSVQFGNDGTWAYVVATYPTFVIALHEEYSSPAGAYTCTYWKHDFAQVEEAIAFGPGEQVELAFVYTTMAKAITAAEAHLSDATLEALGKNIFDEVQSTMHDNYGGKVDLEGDIIPLDELEKAAYAYVENSRAAGVNHERDGEGPRVIGHLVESFFATEEKYVAMGIPADVAKTLNQGWFVGYRIEDEEVWKAVKDGTYKMFSVHGKSKKKYV